MFLDKKQRYIFFMCQLDFILFQKKLYSFFIYNVCNIFTDCKLKMNCTYCLKILNSFETKTNLADTY